MCDVRGLLRANGRVHVVPGELLPPPACSQNDDDSAPAVTGLAASIEECEIPESRQTAADDFKVRSPAMSACRVDAGVRRTWP